MLDVPQITAAGVSKPYSVFISLQVWIVLRTVNMMKYMCSNISLHKQALRKHTESLIVLLYDLGQSV